MNASFVVTVEIPEPGLSILSEAGEVTVLKTPVSAAELKAVIVESGADVVLSQPRDSFDASLLSFLKERGVKGISNFGVGYNNIDVDAARSEGLRVGNTPGVLSDATADIAFLLLLGAARRAGEADAYLRQGRWQGFAPDFMLGADVSGASLGLAGFGRIGKAVARRALGFGMKVSFTQRPGGEERPVGDEELGELAGRVQQVPWERLYRENDFLSLHVPLTERTRHLIDAKVLEAMPSHSILINTARGPIVDEKALVKALEAGHIHAAGLDVFEDEPQIAEGLVELPQTFLLPHLGSATRTVRAKMAEIAAKNAVAMARGEEPLHAVV